MRKLSFFDPSLPRRLVLGSLLALCGLAGAVPDLVRAAIGGRFREQAGVVVDLCARAGALAVAATIAAFCAAGFGPLWRRRGPAGALAAWCIWPIAVAVTVERGPGFLPSRPLPWIFSTAFAIGVGVYVYVRYPHLATRTRERYIAARAAQIARIRRRTAG